MLKETPGPAFLRLLQENGIEASQLLIYTKTDIDRLGRYREQWLVVTDEKLLLLSDGDTPQIGFSLDFKEAKEFRCQSVVGSGLLQARVAGTYVDILRYSNKLADRFHKIARKLDRHLGGQPIEIHPEDDVDPRRCASCGLMLSFVGDACPRCVNRGAVLVRMLRLLSSHGRLAVVLMLLLVCGIALDLVAPQLTRFLVDHVLHFPEEAALGIRPDDDQIRNALGLLLRIVVILAAVQICRASINMINGRLSNGIGTTITSDMRGRLFRHLEQLSISYYDRQQIGSLVGRVAYDTEALHGFILQLTSGFLFQLIMVIGVGVMMFSLNAKLALFTLIPAPLVIMGSFLFWKRIYPRYYRYWDASSKQAGMLSGILSGIRVVKAFGQEQREMERFNRASEHLKQTRRRVDLATATFNPIMALVFQLGGWIVWFVGGRNVLFQQMSLGSLMAFLGYLVMFYGPLTMLTQFTNWLTQFATQAHRIFEILDTPAEIVDSQHPVETQVSRGEIVFDGVTFGYSQYTPVLNNVSLRIEPGEMVGVVGRSGSGKTTIVNLIGRFYDVNEGSVMIDSIDVRQMRKENLRRDVGIVLQDPFLFRGSIFDNIIYGKPESTLEAIIEAAKASSSHDFIMRKGQGYDTWVGEQGSGLSGGERQRAAIARVLLTDPRILILDEATSSVDAESEAAIQSALAEIVKGRTTIAIAHRLSTLRRASRILVVDNGMITESGSHEELMERDGIYARLLRIQGQMTAPSVERLSVEEEKVVGIPDLTASSLPHPLGHRPRWLEPHLASFHTDQLGSMNVTLEGEGIYRGVFSLRCFPVHYPSRYISLRFLNKKKREIEIGLIRDLIDWPQEDQRLIQESLLTRYFLHTVLSISSVQVFGSYLGFKAVTDQGPMEFMMRWQTDRAQDYGALGKLLIDTEENRYLIPDIKKLPEKEQSIFQRYIYW